MRKIAVHTLQYWGEPQRDAYISKLFEAFGRLSETPQSATKVDAIREGYRKIPHGSHVIFFRESKIHGVEVIRALRYKSHKQILWNPLELRP